jgi:F1F0 ATPase subunit 2
MSASIPLNVTAYGMLGIALGAAYFAALRLNVRLYCDGVSVWKTLLVHLLRIVAVGSAFTACARHGALPLLSGLGGFLVMRTVSLRRCDLLFKLNIPTRKGAVGRA